MRHCLIRTRQVMLASCNLYSNSEVVKLPWFKEVEEGTRVITTERSSKFQDLCTLTILPKPGLRIKQAQTIVTSWHVGMYFLERCADSYLQC